jgi:signal transduction histidine kinase
LGPARADFLFKQYEKKNLIDLSEQPIANADLVNYTETHLAGAIGAAAAKVVISSISSTEAISLEEMFKVLDQTQEIIQYSRALETKSKELKKMTVQLQDANEQLKELDRLKADFITTVTHELRTPITSIKALSKILHENQDIPSNQKEEFLSIMMNESERIARLINQVLDVEKIQSTNTEDWAWENFDLIQTLKRAYKGIAPLMEEKGIQGQLQIIDSQAIIHGDEDRITQVIVNLLSNALKFCDPQNGLIEVKLQRIKNQYYLSVKDNGKGIPNEKQKLIFDKFTQLNDKKTGKPHGSGLGLFISKTIVELHKGKLKVESKPERGAKFTIILPLSEKN